MVDGPRETEFVPEGKLWNVREIRQMKPWRDDLFHAELEFVVALCVVTVLPDDLNALRVRDEGVREVNTCLWQVSILEADAMKSGRKGRVFRGQAQANDARSGLDVF
jgi:hypothetical protein